MRVPNKKINIAIIGAGWFGCHIGYKLLQKNFKVKIFEKEKDIFLNASGNNTNRLHLGFHYPRSFLTRKMSYEGYKKFIKQYPNLSKTLKNNIYVIAKSKLNKMNSDLYEKSMQLSNLKFSKLNLKKN
jgi:L-2-hydroxyglutarate oxidase LhgO